MRTKHERLEPLLLRTQLLGYETERSEMERWTGTPEGTWHKSCGYYGKWTSFLPFRVQLRIGCEDEWSAFDPLPKLTQASDKDVRIIVGKERESYEPELNSKDTRQSAQKWNVGLEHRKGLGTSRADISGSGRQSCEPEFNYTRIR